MKQGGQAKTVNKKLKSIAIFLLALILIFFNLLPDLLSQLGVHSFESELRIKNAFAAQEIRKPTSHIDNAGTVNPANAYDTTTGGDTTTYSSTINNSTQNPAIVFNTWQTTGNTYTVLMLYVRRSSSGFTNNSWGIQYSVNGGGSWADLDALTPARNIAAGNVSVSLSPGQNLSQVQVKLILSKSKNGSPGAEVRIYDIWTDGSYTPDIIPPTPDPMTFASPPANDSSSQISMTSTAGTDSTLPISYLFSNDNSGCGLNAGTGGTTGTWQASALYNNSGLAANKCYGYKVAAQDAVLPIPNTGSASAIISVYTSANTPGTPTLTGAAISTLNLANAENGNPAINPTTFFAVQMVTTNPNDAAWLNQWLDASGNHSATAVWLTDAQLDASVLKGLQPNTTYGVKVKARNQDNDETPLSIEGQGTTLALPGPNTISYVNTETALSYANCATSGCGGRLNQTITISGSGFGSLVANRDVCTAGSTNGCVKIGNYTVPAASISIWNDTQITLTIPLNISVFGGAGTSCGAAGAGICITQNGISDSGGALEFWVFPSISSVSPAAAGEGREGDNITIAGTRFDTGAATGTVVFQNCAAGDVPAAIGSWGDTSISVTVPSGIADNDDYCDIKITRAVGTGSKIASSSNFTVLPNYTVIVPSGFPGNHAREYNIGDTDGLVMLSGSHLGNSGSAAILGSAASLHAAVEGPCTSGGYSPTAVCLEVPSAISDSLYSGNIILTRADAKAYTFSTFYILPRITSLNPISGSGGDAVTLAGNHFCQTGLCPAAFDSSNYLRFNNNATSTVFYAWTHSSASGTVPNDAITGNVNLVSNAIYSSNSRNFTVLSLVPDSPTSLRQFNNPSLTSEILVGGISSSTPLYLTMIMQVGIAGGMLYPQIEYQPIGSSFVCSAGACTSATEGTGAAGPGPVDCSQAANACAIAISPAENVYHWQARIRHNKGGTNYYSPWASFPITAPNSEGATDFQIHINGPTITFPGIDTCADAVTSLFSNSATISWALNENATGQVEYATSSDLSTATSFPQIPQASAGAHTITLPNIDSGTTYYFRVKSVDVAGNTTVRPAPLPFCSFTTLSVTNPGKTTMFYINGATGAINSSTSSSFFVYIPETVYDIKSAFVELTGLTAPVGTNNIEVSVNGQATSTYAIAAGESSFRILYPVAAVNLNLYPALNIFAISPSLSTDIVSAQIYVTYSYKP